MTRITKAELLRRCNKSGIEAMIIRPQLRWSGHVVRMPDYRMLKRIFYVELESSHRNKGERMKRYKDVVKSNTKASRMIQDIRKVDASDRLGWRKICHNSIATLETDSLTALEVKQIYIYIYIYIYLYNYMYVYIYNYRKCRNYIKKLSILFTR